ncbi:MAG: HAD hydrolase-like protein [Thermaerobacter sp.]|nr:HAD hydrolase-like protein [Thermaerobacter sp.]
MLRVYLACYQDGQRHLTLDPVLANVLARLKAQSVKVALLTNQARDTTEMTLNHLDSQEQFDLVITAQDIPQPKPAPDGIELGLRTWRVPTRQARLIGDTQNAIGAARTAGSDVRQAAWYLPAVLPSASYPVAGSPDAPARYLWPKTEG